MLRLSLRCNLRLVSKLPILGEEALQWRQLSAIGLEAQVPRIWRPLRGNQGGFGCIDQLDGVLDGFILRCDGFFVRRGFR